MHGNALPHSTGRRQLWSKVARLCASLSVSIAIGHVPANAAENYRLGPQDAVKIRVFEWRPSTGVPFEWVPLNGEFAVSAAGNLSLPIIGTMQASGKTVEEISNAISDRLQNQVGLQKRPTASVEISSYRPLFVTGMVTTPGKYNFSPGLTVVQALSMAGGIGQSDSNMIGLQRDALSDRGELSALEGERFELIARQSRVDATISEASQIAFPEELTSRKGETGIDRMMNEEAALFETRKRSMNTEIDALAQTKVLATQEIAALREKAASIAKQIALANKDLGSVNKLISQGLTVSARQLGATQNVADLESRNLDVSLAILRTEQNLAKVDQDIGDVKNRYRVAALTEAAELRDRFASNAKRMKTTSALLRNLEVRAPAAMLTLEEDNTPYAFETTINRVVDGSNQTLIVSDNDPVLPGDVIRVDRRERDKGVAKSNSN
jgi:polysaccharide export outer membrane protein